MKRSICIFIIITCLLFQVTNVCSQEKVNNQEKLQPKLDICLVLDNSGSMKTNDPNFLTREVVSNFIATLGENARLGMVIFDTEALLAEPLTMLSDKAKADFLKSMAKVNYKGSWTNTPAGIERAIYELKTDGRDDAAKVIIFLTDGIVDTGNKKDDEEKVKWLKEELAQDSQKAGIRIFGIAFTEKADFSLIQSLALKTDGQYYRAYKAEDISNIFNKINAVITKPVQKTEVPASPPPAEVEKADTAEKVTQEKAPASPAKEKEFLKSLIAASVAVLGIIILFLVFRRKPKPVVSPGTAAKTPSVKDKKEPPIPKAELIDEQCLISKKPIILNKMIMNIGRDPGRDISIPKETVSALHATIKYEGGYFSLEDQRSSNKTCLNGKEIVANKRIPLKSGDRITFDVYNFKLHLPDEVPAGGTVLSKKNKKQPPKGTVLRSAKKQKAATEPEPKAALEKPEDFAQDKRTMLKPKSDKCPNHPVRKAVELCPQCKKIFCPSCMTEKNGKAMCLQCA